ncbi:MAG TPA: ABC transporter permease/substrate-binding protein [Polyangiaceae bacterium]|jgi:osmoprotectant transport system permease protein
MNRALSELLTGLPPLLASHIALTLSAVTAGVVIALPLSLAAIRWPKLAYFLLAATTLVQTIPGLALLALMVPLIAATGGLFVGASAFGFTPAVIALSLYALLPILRNAVTGLLGVDDAAVEAARGMGMSPRQLFFDVELPLAAPVIAAGVRTAATWTVGAATLATPVGQRCLGNYIFAGLQTRNFPMVLIGVAAASLLALLLDLGLAGIERGLAARRAGLVLGACAGLVLLLGAGLASARLSSPKPSAAPADPPATARATAPTEHHPAVTKVRLGAKTFTEQYILVAVLRRLLEAQGIAVEVAESLGSTVVFDALRHGDVDAYVDYSGTIFANVMKRQAGGSRWQVDAEVAAYLGREEHVRDLGTLGFENAYALAVRRETAERLGLRSIADLAGPAASLRIAGDYEFFGRPEWASVRDTYRLHFKSQTSFDPALLYEALLKDESDVVAVFSSDGRIAADNLVVLADPAAALPPYDAILLLGPRVSDDALVVCALSVLRDSIPVGLMRQANQSVDRAVDKASPAQAAAWLLEQAKIAPGACRPR